jgi:uncharacterized membrane protein
MDRQRLDAFCALHRLPAPAVATALALTGQQPDATAWRVFAATLLHAAGLGALGAGILFFVAANWQDYGVIGRFALLQGALLACVGVALWRPMRYGPSALILATLLTGASLALFGQTYQTGADVHELFFTWALLALPFALAGRSGALWAVWWGVLNAGLALLCGWLAPDHFVWRLITGRGLDRSALLMLPCVIDLLGAGLFLALRGTRLADAAPLWLVRFLAGLGVLFGTAAALRAVTAGAFHDVEDPLLRQGVVSLAGFAAICAGIGFETWRRRRDVFPMALLAASWIAISTTWLARALRFNDLGSFFMLAFWLIAVSTGAGMLLMHWSRTWRASTAPNGAAA